MWHGVISIDIDKDFDKMAEKIKHFVNTNLTGTGLRYDLILLRSKSNHIHAHIVLAHALETPDALLIRALLKDDSVRLNIDISKYFLGRESEIDMVIGEMKK